MADGATPPLVTHELREGVYLGDGTLVDVLVVQAPTVLAGLEATRATWAEYALRILDAPKGGGKTYLDRAGGLVLLEARPRHAEVRDADVEVVREDLVDAGLIEGLLERHAPETVAVESVALDDRVAEILARLGESKG
ncbi:MAG: hypothetical protein Q8P18_16290 [Pseudomonadota bacterium]|nr:hypothetical protein [Pseudomonadota bacterium]